MRFELLGRILKGTVPAAFALALVAQPGSAQCLTPDNLNGPCWDFTNLNIPPLPGISLPAKTICWIDCIPQDACARIRIDPPVPTTDCGVYSADMVVEDCFTGVALMSGTARLVYTRNWEEMKPIPGTPNHEVWRFLVQVDLDPPPPGFSACQIPTCLGPTPSAFYYGYIDYARDCGSPQFSSALSLFHNCDYFIHQGALSSRPGLFHPRTSYAIVAPDFPTNPFVPSSVTRFGGPLVGEAVRNVTNSIGVFACQNEELITAGDLVPYFDLCWCFNFDFTNDHNTLSELSGAGSCVDSTGLPSLFASQSAFFPLLPWLDVFTTSIGSWSNDTSYPGAERVWAEEGLFQYYDSCPDGTGIPGFAQSLEIMYGASTRGGYAVFPSPVGFTTENFLDMGDNWSFEFGGPPAPPALFGSILGPTDHLIYVNTP